MRSAERMCASRTLEIGHDGASVDIGTVAVLDPVPSRPEYLESEERALESTDAARMTDHDPGGGLHIVRNDRVGRDVTRRTEIHRQLAPDEVFVVDHGERRDGPQGLPRSAVIIRCRPTSRAVHRGWAVGRCENGRRGSPAWPGPPA